MGEIQQIGIDLILRLQQFSPTLDGVMRGLSALGTEAFYVLMLTFVYWCIDVYLGVRIAVLLVASNFVNTLEMCIRDSSRCARSSATPVSSGCSSAGSTP